ncbi:hypothetical protein HWV62_38572 [Athelia sp. TMB]|nr:hypothetical protein HWV62_17722 [Athelia sp. TMB]KAF7986175.1 hypothetical protein HWV62_38572 [Athelia sp. TMB]
MAPTPTAPSLPLPPLTAIPTNSKARPQRKKVNDDAAYFGPPTGALGVKRPAIDRADGEPRVKRKRMDVPVFLANGNNGIAKRVGERPVPLEGGDLNVSLIDFKKMSTETLYGYIAQYDLIPPIVPSPLSALDPPPPLFLEHTSRQNSLAPSPAPLTTPANRPRRDPKDSRRRHSRFQDDDIAKRTPILSDVNEFNGVLADIAEKHFRETNLKEVDTLASFMCALSIFRFPSPFIPFKSSVKHPSVQSTSFRKMKFSASTLCFVLPLLAAQVSALSVPRADLARERGFGQHSGGQSSGSGAAAAAAAAAAAKGKGSKGAASSSVGAAASSTAAAAASTAAAASNSTAAAGNSTAPPSTVDSSNAQTSLTLDPAVIASGFAQNGQATQEAGQVASLTSTNNYINFCATTNQPLTNGAQVKTGSCNPAPMGQIPATTAMPSAKFTFPKNLDNIATENTAFTVTMAIQNMETGNFVNAQTNYFSAPQQLNAQGQIIGHSHVVIEALTAIDQTTPTDPTTFAFFLGLNAAAQNGVLTADVTNGLPAGVYKLTSINTAANHQPVLVPVAQHGSTEDSVYFTVGGSNSTTAATGSAAASSAAPAAAAATSAAASSAAKGGAAAAAGAAAKGAAGKNKNGKGGRRFIRELDY